jgi:predicted DNA-binding protein (UPF0251 family)
MNERDVMALNSRQIEAFRAVILTGTMVQAANALSISQPAVSRLIADLERDLGYLLFNRTLSIFGGESNYAYRRSDGCGGAGRQWY